jgi:hypothetical protein
MNWFYWNTAWSLFFSLVWFMTITHNPDAQISDAHLRDEAFGGWMKIYVTQRIGPKRQKPEGLLSC